MGVRGDTVGMTDEQVDQIVKDCSDELEAAGLGPEPVSGTKGMQSNTYSFAGSLGFLGMVLGESARSFYAPSRRPACGRPWTPAPATT